MIKEPRIREFMAEPDASPQLARTVVIETHSDRARAWIHRSAIKFGQLCHEPFSDGRQWSLYLYRACDRSEVVAYLNDLWDSECWPEEVGEEIAAEEKRS